MQYFCTLASGSSGNAALYVGNRARILIDAGTSCRYIRTMLRALGLDASELTDIVITHTHTDHISALPVLLGYTGARLWCSEGAWGELCRIAGDERPQAFSVGQTLALEDVSVRAFPTMHDSPGSVGYILGEGASAVGVCTDLGCVTPQVLDALAGVRAAAVESNHDTELVRTGPYPAFLKARILSDSGHLSNEACASLVEKLARTGTRRFVLAHLSEKNNTPRHAERAAHAALCRLGAQDDVGVCVAPRRGALEPVLL